MHSLYPLLWSIQSPVLRDLLSLLQMPAIIDSHSIEIISTEQRRTWIQEALDWINIEDQYPENLHHFTNTKRQYKLGLYAEDLIHYYLRFGSPYRVLHHDVQIFREKRSIGALDFLLQSPTGQIEHWEMAVKFYVQHKSSPHMNSWIGPEGKDSLHNKMTKFTEKQIPLSHSVEGRLFLEQQGITTPVQQRIVMMGMLFRPWKDEWTAPAGMSAHQPQGTWIHRGDFFMEFYDSPHLWSPRRKPKWLAPKLCTDSNELLTALEILDAPMERGNYLMVSQMQPCPLGWEEIHRWIIVGDDWQCLNEDDEKS